MLLKEGICYAAFDEELGLDMSTVCPDRSWVNEFISYNNFRKLKLVEVKVTLVENIDS